MKKLFTFLAIICILTANAQNRSFTVNGFDKLKMGNAFNITVTKGAFSVQASGRQEDIKDLEARVENGTLRIDFSDGKGWSWGKDRKDIVINITMPSLKGINFSGATESKISGFTSRTFDIDLSGASNTNINISADNVRINCSGASDVKLVGDADMMVADVSGASELKAMDFKVKNIKVTSSGASDARVFASESIVANASGASDIKYKGTKNIKKSTSGSSDVSED